MTPKQVKTVADRGHKGADKDFSTVRFVQPVKKKRKRKLPKKQNRYNCKLAHKRVAVEHTIAKSEKYGIMENRFRNSLKGYDRASSMISGLVKFRIMRANGICRYSRNEHND